MILKEYILALMLSLAGPSSGKPKSVDLIAENDRIVAMADGMAAAIEKNQHDVLFTGDHAEYGAATWLAAIAWNESKYRHSIQKCIRRGDGGESLSAFQTRVPYALMKRLRFVRVNRHGSWVIWKWKKRYTVEQLCANDLIAAEQSLHLFSVPQRVCKKSTLIGWIAGYGSGNCSRTHVRAIQRVCMSMETQSRKFGLSGLRCRKKSDLEFKDLEDAEKRVATVIKRHHQRVTAAQKKK